MPSAYSGHDLPSSMVNGIAESLSPHLKERLSQEIIHINLRLYFTTLLEAQSLLLMPIGSGRPTNLRFTTHLKVIFNDNSTISAIITNRGALKTFGSAVVFKRIYSCSMTKFGAHLRGGGKYCHRAWENIYQTLRRYTHRNRAAWRTFWLSHLLAVNSMNSSSSTALSPAHIFNISTDCSQCLGPTCYTTNHRS